MVIPSIDRLITDLDRKTQQVEIEARVVAATRSFARDIGTQLGFGLGKSGPNSLTSDWRRRRRWYFSTLARSALTPLPIP